MHRPRSLHRQDQMAYRCKVLVGCGPVCAIHGDRAVKTEKACAAALRELRDNHTWLCALALNEAFAQHGQNTLNWAILCEAARHAGAAKALYDATNAIEV